ncbi:SWIM zinc finger family protein [uncultured Roseobacter sp.]|uniref:SWIM zinc finger family protein n=1 Tax=uncultured Roseobacter sp. TaxID=114847 RepID=UPI00260A5DAA|nr:SWIM zinc finger family protein [uncultured Roseobacter sp.]
MSALEQNYRYLARSALRDHANGQTLALVSDTSASPANQGQFLKARALYPDVTARGLRAVSEIVGSRFYVPPSMLARMLREADPVATVSSTAVRFEGFSACCSAYIRLDLDQNALNTTLRRKGTVNVDFGAEMRSTLAQMSTRNTLDLTIGADAVEVARDGQAIVEKKVPLPLRWIKGFAEVQTVMAGMTKAYTLKPMAAQRFLRQLPRGKSDHLQWLTLAGDLPRLTMREVPGAVPLRGAHRLRALEVMAGLCERLEVYVNRDTGASAWVLELAAQRLCLVLNANPWRGFSGDGGLLSQIATSDGSGAAALRAQLCWQEQLDEVSLAAATGLSVRDTRRAMAELAAVGLLGFDLKENRYFHRVLPFDLERIAAMNPRLNAAQKLLDKGAVQMIGKGAEVRSAGVIHRVDAHAEGWRCTCPWYAKHAGGRGPCKHVLAVEMQVEQGA